MLFRSILQGSDDPDLRYNQIIRPWKSRLGLVYVERHGVVLDLKLIALTFVNAVSRQRSLAAIQVILRNLGASDELRRVAERVEPLPAAPPAKHGSRPRQLNRERCDSHRSPGDRFLRDATAHPLGPRLPSGRSLERRDRI